MNSLHKYGLENLLNLKYKRKIGFIDNDKSLIKNIETILIKENIDDKLNFIIIEKNNSTDFSMKWHLDDAQIILHKNNYDKSLFKEQIFISRKKAINYPSKKPILSLIIYLSEYGDDFTGGTFEFVDEIIFPKRNMYLLFDSKEVHRVNMIKSGIRKNILIKFYNDY